MTDLFIINNNNLITVEGTFRNQKYWGSLRNIDKIILDDNLTIIKKFKGNKFLGNTITQIMSNFTTEEISHLNNLFIENQKIKNYSQYTKKQLGEMYSNKFKHYQI